MPVERTRCPPLRTLTGVLRLLAIIFGGRLESYGACLIGNVPIKATVKPMLAYLPLLILCLLVFAFVPALIPGCLVLHDTEPGHFPATDKWLPDPRTLYWHQNATMLALQDRMSRQCAGTGRTS